MKSLERRFQAIRERNPYWGDLICFSEAVARQNFQPQIVARWFNQLVDKNDYLPRDKKDILIQLNNLSKSVEDDRK